MNIREINDKRPIWYLIFVLLILGGFYIFLGKEQPQESKMVFNNSNEPGMEQLFVPIKLDTAKILFAQPVIIPESKLKITSTEEQLTIQGDVLEELLDEISMRSTPMWKDLQKFDSILFISEDCKTLRLGIYNDEKTGEKYVNVPAGFLRTYIN